MLNTRDEALADLAADLEKTYKANDCPPALAEKLKEMHRDLYPRHAVVVKNAADRAFHDALLKMNDWAAAIATAQRGLPVRVDGPASRTTLRPAKGGGLELRYEYDGDIHGGMRFPLVTRAKTATGVRRALAQSIFERRAATKRKAAEKSPADRAMDKLFPGKAKNDAKENAKAKEKSAGRSI